MLQLDLKHAKVSKEQISRVFYDPETKNLVFLSSIEIEKNKFVEYILFKISFEKIQDRDRGHFFVINYFKKSKDIDRCLFFINYKYAGGHVRKDVSELSIIFPDITCSYDVKRGRYYNGVANLLGLFSELKNVLSDSSIEEIIQFKNAYESVNELEDISLEPKIETV